MSGKKDFDISQYLNNGVVSLENLNIADSTIAALQMEWIKNSLVMQRCSLENVVFENHCGRGFVEMSDCEFTNCVFHDTLGNGKINVEQSTFTNCIFEGICLNGAFTSSKISQCKFNNCKFLNIDIKWVMSLYDSELIGGEIKQLSLVGHGYMTRVQISNMQIEGMKIWGEYFYEDRIENTVLRDVVLIAKKHEINFINCDEEGLTLTEGTFGFESL